MSAPYSQASFRSHVEAAETVFGSRVEYRLAATRHPDRRIRHLNRRDAEARNGLGEPGSAIRNRRPRRRRLLAATESPAAPVNNRDLLIERHLFEQQFGAFVRRLLGVAPRARNGGLLRSAPATALGGQRRDRESRNQQRRDDVS